MNAATWKDKIFETPTVLLSGHVSGEEEVPVGVQALLFLVSLSHLLSYQLHPVASSRIWDIFEALVTAPETLVTGSAGTRC